MRTCLFLGVLVTGLVDPLLAKEALGQDMRGPLCFPRDEVVARLGTNYREAPAGIGIRSAAGTLYELFRSSRADDSGEQITGETWTLFETFPDKVSCLRAAGEDWVSFEAAKPMGPQL